MVQGKRTNANIIGYIDMLAGLGFGATEIHNALLHYHKSSHGLSLTTCYRTIQKYANYFPNSKDAEPWSLLHMDGMNSEDVRNLLLAYKELIPLFKWGKVLTVGEAHWLVRVLKVAQGLGPIKAFYLATQYLLRELGERKGYPTRPDYSDLDGFLVYQPWIQGNLDSYLQAIENKQVRPVFGWNILVETSTDEIRMWVVEVNKMSGLKGKSDE